MHAVLRAETGDHMAKYECENCGWKGKPLFMEPATRLCPSCRSINVKKIKKEK